MNVQRVLHLHPFQHAIQHDEGARAPHTRTAVHHQWRAVVVREILPDTLDELDEAGLVSRHPVIGPSREMEVSDGERLRVVYRLDTVSIS